MDGYTYETAKNHIISAYNLLAPTGKEQIKFAEFVNQIDMDQDKSPLDKLRWLIVYLHDGVEWGNW